MHIFCHSTVIDNCLQLVCWKRFEHQRQKQWRHLRAKMRQAGLKNVNNAFCAVWRCWKALLKPSSRCTERQPTKSDLSVIVATFWNFKIRVQSYSCTLSALGLASSACVASPPCLAREVVDQMSSRPEHWQRLKPREELGDPPGVWTQTGLSTARKPPTWGKGNQMAPRSALLPFPWHKQAWSCQCGSH